MSFSIKTVSSIISSCSRLIKKRGAFGNISNKRLSTLQKDVLQIRKEIFTPIEETIMEKVRPLKLEQTYIINKEGALDSKIKFNRSKRECSIAHGQSMKIMEEVLEDAVIIHNHPSKVSLSAQDVVTIAKFKVKKIIATTPDGGYSMIKRKEKWSDEMHNMFKMACYPLIEAENLQIEKLAKIRGIRNAERTNMLNDWRCEQYNNLAQKFDLIFSNKISKTTSLDQTHNEVFKINLFKNFADNIIFQTQKFSAKPKL